MSSEELDWRRIAVQRASLAPTGFLLPALEAHLVTVHLKGAPALDCRIGRQAHDGQAAAWDATIVPAGTASTWGIGNDCDLLQICLDPDLVVAAGDEVVAPYPAPVAIEPAFLVRDATLTRIAEDLLTELQTPSLATGFYAETLARLLAVHLLRSYSTLSGLIDTGPYAISPARLRRALVFIEENLGSQLSVTAVAEVVGMTLYHFAKTFKRATGYSPYRYITERRVDRARRLLVETDLDIAHVAQRVGLSSQSHFTALFARHTGLTPKRYRDLMRG